jgi:WD40 repeat protein
MDTEILRLSAEHGDLHGVAWSPDGKKLATGSALNTARVWDATSGKEVVQLMDQSQPVSHLEWSPDGTRLAGINKAGLVSVSSLGKAEKPLVLGNRAVVTSLAWSPDGNRLAIASEDKTVGIWDANTGRESGTLTGHDDSISSLAWSPDSTRLVTVGMGTWADRNGRITFAASTIVWDVQLGQLATKRESGTPILGVAWSPDGARLATATQDHKTIISEAATGKEMVTLNGHADAVLTVAWSPDGKRLLTGSADKTAKIWDARTGRELQTLTGQSAEVVGVIWNPSGKKIAVSSSDGVVQIYTTDIHELIAVGRGRVTAHPSQQGCQKYLGLARCAAYPELPWW